MINHVRSIDDQHRPVTFVANVPVYSDLAVSFFDGKMLKHWIAMLENDFIVPTLCRLNTQMYSVSTDTSVGTRTPATQK